MSNDEGTVRASAAGSASLPGWIAEANANADRRILVTGGCVVSMDPDIGEFERADVLIEGDTIKAVGSNLQVDADSVTVIDAAGTIVLPGLVDTHRHMWQAQLRRMIPNVDIPVYLGLRNAIAVEFRPEDQYVSTLVNAHGALYTGVTTILDLSHNTRTAHHADAGVDALEEAGIRGVFAYAPPEAGEWDHQWPDDLARIKAERFDKGDGRLQLRMAQRSVSEFDTLTAERIGIARDIGIGMCMDPVAWDEASVVVADLGAQGLLGPDLIFVHCADLSEAAWRAMGEADVQVALSPFVDELLGFDTSGGLPTVQRALDVGIRPGISVDIETTVPGDVFTQMRALLAVQRMRASLGNPDADREQLTVRDALSFATIDGARTLGLEDVCGSLTPGKKADILLLDQRIPTGYPFNNAYGAIVMGGDVGSIACVVASGEIKRWGPQLVGVDTDHWRREIENSRDYLLSRIQFELDPFVDYPSADFGPPQYRP